MTPPRDREFPFRPNRALRVGKRIALTERIPAPFEFRNYNGRFAGIPVRRG